MVVVLFLDNPIDVGNGDSDKERDGEGWDVKARSPKTDKDSVDDPKNSEPPADALKGDLFTRVGELVKNEAK